MSSTEERRPPDGNPTAVDWLAIHRAGECVHEHLLNVLRHKGYGTFASFSEIESVIHAECEELAQAVRKHDGLRAVRHELMDIAVAAIFSMACIDTNALVLQEARGPKSGKRVQLTEAEVHKTIDLVLRTLHVTYVAHGWTAFVSSHELESTIRQTCRSLTECVGSTSMSATVRDHLSDLPPLCILGMACLSKGMLDW